MGSSLLRSPFAKISKIFKNSRKMKKNFFLMMQSEKFVENAETKSSAAPAHNEKGEY
jgi:hypothetical protein